MRVLDNMDINKEWVEASVRLKQILNRLALIREKDEKLRQRVQVEGFNENIRLQLEENSKEYHLLYLEFIDLEKKSDILAKMSEEK